MTVEKPLPAVLTCAYCGTAITLTTNHTVMLYPRPLDYYCNEDCAGTHLSDQLDCNLITDSIYINAINSMHRFLRMLPNGRGFWECIE